MRKLNVWPFNRRKQTEDSTVPPELQHYYESEHRERVGLAWLIAFLSLLLTISVILGLFFGGRWAYRKIANNDNTDQTKQVVGPNQPIKPLPGPSTSKTPSSSQSKTTVPTKSSNPKKTTSSTPYTPKTTAKSKPRPKAVSSSQPSSTKLTNTGPGNNLAIFLGVSALGTALHSLYSRNRLKMRTKN